MPFTLNAAHSPWPELWVEDYEGLSEVEQLIFLAARAGFRQVPVAHWKLRWEVAEALGERGFRGEKRYFTSGTSTDTSLASRWYFSAHSCSPASACAVAPAFSCCPISY